MTLIAGASQYLNQATLSNTQGFAAVSSDILSQSVGSLSLLDVGRNNAVDGVGLSSRARLLNQQFLSSTSGTYNTLFSTSGAAAATPESALTQIRGLMSSVPASRETPAAREATAEAQAELEAQAEIAADASDSASSRGSILDTQA